MRAYEHVTHGARRGSSYLYQAMRKHGVDAFSIRVLAHEDDWATLCRMEREAIVSYGTKAPAGYNSTDGGDGVPGMDPETKAKHRVNTSTGTAIAWAEGRMDHRALTRATPEFKQRHREATRDGVNRMYADPARREKIVAVLTSAEKRESNRRAALVQWAQPGALEKAIAARSKDERSASAKAGWERWRKKRRQSDAESAKVAPTELGNQGAP